MCLSCTLNPRSSGPMANHCSILTVTNDTLRYAGVCVCVYAYVSYACNRYIHTPVYVCIHRSIYIHAYIQTNTQIYTSLEKHKIPCTLINKHSDKTKSTTISIKQRSSSFDYEARAEAAQLLRMRKPSGAVTCSAPSKNFEIIVKWDTLGL